MVAMLFIVVAHILGQGGILDAAEKTSSQFWGAWMLEICAVCSVNCYALISGYVGIKSKYKYSNLATLWFRVIFYTVLITGIFKLYMPEEIGVLTCLKAICPVMTNQYWYFTSYVCLFLFIPILNKAIETLSRKQLAAVVMGMFLIFSCLQTLLGDHMGTRGGYSGLWLIILYIIGAYINKYDVFKTPPLRALQGYIIAILISWGSKFFIVNIAARLGTDNFWGMQIGCRQDILISFISPTILAASVFLLIIFKQLRLGLVLKKIISFFSPFAFSVYLIHAHPLFWEYILKDRFVSYASLDTPFLIIVVIITAIIIYLICTCIDMIREIIFKKLNLQKKFYKIENKYCGSIWE